MTRITDNFAQEIPEVLTDEDFLSGYETARRNDHIFVDLSPLEREYIAKKLYYQFIENESMITLGYIAYVLDMDVIQNKEMLS